MENEKKPEAYALGKDWSMASSQIERTKYDKENKKMYVTFKTGATYEYDGVPENIWKLSLITSSIGSFMNSSIKGKYPYRKL